MSDPDEMERHHTLLTATMRYDELRMREALAAIGGEVAESDTTPLGRAESLELLALSEVVIRKAGYGRQAMVRTARRAGASWTQIGAAVGSSKQAAWEAHTRWIAEQEHEHGRTGYTGLDPDDVGAAQRLAGHPDA